VSTVSSDGLQEFS